MRIAVYHNLPSGGAKRALYNYTRGLVAGGHEVDVFAPPTADESFQDLRPLVHRYVTIPLHGGPAAPLRKWIVHEVVLYASLWLGLERHSRVAAAAIDAGGYDLAFVHHCRFSQSPWMLRYLERTPSVYYCQEPRRSSFEYSHRFPPRLQTRRGRAIQRANLLMSECLLGPRDIAAARSADLILANSSYSIESIKRAYGRYARLAYLGADLSLFAPSDHPRDRMILSVGAVHPAKGHELVIDAAGAIAPESRPTVHVVADRALAGHQQVLRELADRRGVTLVLHEDITDAQLVERYRAARLTICAAELEPFGFTPVESMACGTPVVAVDEAGYRESVIDGVNGVLVERDARKMGAAIAVLLDDDPRWSELQHGAKQSAARWSTSAADARLAELLADLPAPQAASAGR